MRLTPELLRAATGCTIRDSGRFAEPLDAACVYYAIGDSLGRQAAFLAQLAHESGSLRHTVELWGPTKAQQGYEGRKDLGNTEPGDGSRYRGRGLIQVTGRFNYREVTRWLAHRGCPDFEADPGALEDPVWASWASAAWWERHGCNQLADDGNYVGIGRLINRGNARSKYPANGEADRLLRWRVARAAFQL